MTDQPQPPEPFQAGGWAPVEPPPGAFGGHPPSQYPVAGTVAGPPHTSTGHSDVAGSTHVADGRVGATAPLLATARPGSLPLDEVEYQQLLRGPRRRWWRPLVALPLAAAIGLGAQVFALIPMVAMGALLGERDLLTWLSTEFANLTGAGPIGPGGFLYLNLALVALIPAATLSIWAVHGVRPRYVSSVAGRFRWGWLLRCLLVVLPVWALYLLVGSLGTEAGARPPHWALLLGMVVLLTPLQAAGEEYLFRGWIMQNVGAWFRNPRVSLVVGGVVSTVVFAVAHGSPDPWVLGTIGAFAVTSVVATWRTGGLEAGIALHATHNVGTFAIVLLSGGWEQAFVSGKTTATPLVLALAVAGHAAVLLLILWQARRARVQRRFAPLSPRG